jgi:3-dehydroquinate synthase
MPHKLSGMTDICVELGPRSYPIRFAPASGFAAFVRERLPLAGKALIVADANTCSITLPLQLELKQIGFNAEITLVPAGETSKQLAELAKLYDALAGIRADRATPVIAVGGGVVGDLAGFAAVVGRRGLPLVMVPTTLLAMVDSSVGGKTGINHAAGKNLIGAFHQPAGVWIDADLLKSLPEREYRSGLAEVVKYGVILDAEFFEWLEANHSRLLQRDCAAILHAVKRSCELKALVVQQDEREETGLRAVLNYGHTFAHAFEAVAGYGRWLHGEAVAAGMTCAARLAVALGRIDSQLLERQTRLLAQLQLPIEPEPRWPADALLAAMATDKKVSSGGLRFVLPTKFGHVELVSNIPVSAVREALRP